MPSSRCLHWEMPAPRSAQEMFIRRDAYTSISFAADAANKASIRSSSNGRIVEHSEQEDLSLEWMLVLVLFIENVNKRFHLKVISGQTETSIFSLKMKVSVWSVWAFCWNREAIEKFKLQEQIKAIKNLNYWRCFAGHTNSAAGRS